MAHCPLLTAQALVRIRDRDLLKNTVAPLAYANRANSVFSLTLTLDTNGLNGTRLHL